MPETELARLRRIESAAKHWAYCARRAWPSTHIYELPEPHEGAISAKRMREAELALLEAVEGEK